MMSDLALAQMFKSATGQKKKKKKQKTPVECLCVDVTFPSGVYNKPAKQREGKKR